MNNLFIVHNQYNLILALGLTKSRFGRDHNYVILNSEFNLDEKTHNLLEKIFEKVFVAQKEFYSKSGIYTEIHLYDRLIKTTKCPWIFSTYFDRAFVAQEEYYDTWIISRINKSIGFELCYLEEDIYFSRNESWYDEKEQLNHDRITLKKRLQFLLRQIVFGKNNFYENGCYFYGQNSNYDRLFVLYPDLVRADRRNPYSKIEEVKNDELKAGIVALNDIKGGNLIEYDNCIIIFFDLLARYTSRDTVELIFRKVIESASEDKKIFVKYHPREQHKFIFSELKKEIFEISNNVSAESVLVKSSTETNVIIGYTSCAIQVAAKMGFKTISIAKLCGEDNKYMLDVLKLMGIYIPDTIEALSSYE